MTKTKEERLDIINDLIQFISERGRRFFYTNGTIKEKNVDSVAFMKMKNGRIYFVDNYTTEDVPVINNHREWNNFSHGGTLQALVMDFADFIRTGKYTNGKHGYGGLLCTHWGHDDETQQEIIDYARDIGFLKE